VILPTPVEAMLAHAQKKVPLPETFRRIFGHKGWWVARNVVIVDDRTPIAMWAFTNAKAYEAARAEHGDAMGPVDEVTWLDDALVAIDPRVARLTIDPASELGFQIEGQSLAHFFALASAVRVERAMARNDYRLVRAYPQFLVPRVGDRAVTATGPRGTMIAAFTSLDALDAFLATIAPDDRATVQVVAMPGAELFALAEPMGADGVLVNVAGPFAIGFERAICQQIVAAG
jgi:hypothetical protein